jgi:hypothetical protein
MSAADSPQSGLSKCIAVNNHASHIVFSCHLQEYITAIVHGYCRVRVGFIEHYLGHAARVQIGDGYFRNNSLGRVRMNGGARD